MRRRLMLVATTALAVATALTAAPAAVSAPAGDQPPPLFDLGVTAGRHTKASPHIDRLVPGRASTVTIPLPGGTRHTVTLSGKERVGSADHWSGILEGDPDSLVTVIRDGDIQTAFVSTRSGNYRLTPTASGYVLKKADPSRDDSDVVPTPSPEMRKAAARASSRADAPTSTTTSTAAAPPSTAPLGDVFVNTRVDIVVGWTTGAQAQLGSAAAAQALAALSVATANDAYAASGMALRLNLVGRVLATGTQSLNDRLVLDQVTDPSDGVFDNLTALRESTQADLQSLLVADTLSFCGEAWYPEDDSGFWGASIINHACAVDNLSFPHEVGHNLGAAHDRFVTEPIEAFYPTYGYGYVNLSADWRTIMAYNDECDAKQADHYCPRIARFSNPTVPYAGFPTGIAIGSTNAADNRTAIQSAVGRVSNYRTPFNATVPVQIAGRAGLEANAEAAFLNVTITGAKGNGYATVWPCDRPKPTASTINFATGQTVANSAVIGLSATGTVCYFLSAPAQIILDVAGRGQAALTQGLGPAAPLRILDTRVAGNGGKLSPGVTRVLQVTGPATATAVPAGSTGVVVNLTTVNSAGAGFVTVWPCGAARPTSSSINLRTTGAISNGVTVPLSAAGTICLYANRATDAIIDVNGAIRPLVDGSSRLTAVSPSRVVDSRVSGSGGPLVAKTVRRIQVTGTAGIPAGATAAVVNLTVVRPSANGNVVAYPCGAVPAASTINYVKNEILAGGTTVALDATGGFCLRSTQGSQFIVDVAGSYGATGNGIGTVVPSRLYDSRFL